MTDYCVIRHKETGKLMPQAKRNRGYSHWNPAITEKKMNEALDVPRLINGTARAKRCISQWVAIPNGRRTLTQSWDGEYDDDLDTKPDGRKKEDLEVCPVTLIIGEPIGQS